MASRWFLTISVWAFFGYLLALYLGRRRLRDVHLLRISQLKVEAWLSKQYEKELRQLRKEFAAIGHVRVTLWVYPAGNPSKI